MLPLCNSSNLTSQRIAKIKAMRIIKMRKITKKISKKEQEQRKLLTPMYLKIKKKNKKSESIKMRQ
jgi:hypothetical protein